MRVAMAVTRRVMGGIGPKAVFDVLRDGWSYEKWVVGTRKIRAVEPGWPHPGTAIHYTVGYRPLRKDGETRSKAYEPDELLELEAVAWPAGTARIAIRVEPVHDGTLVTMDEHPNSGPGALAHNPLTDLVVHVRNVETLRRLERLARESGR
jgi:hypothetical protein